MKTALTIGVAFILAAASAQEIGTLTNTCWRIMADFDYDGVSDLAISDPPSSFGNAGGAFTIYLGSTNGQYRAVGSVGMHPLAGNLKRVREGEGLLTIYWRHIGLISYSITATGIVEKAIRPLSARDGAPQADQDLYWSLFDDASRLKGVLTNGPPRPPVRMEVLPKGGKASDGP